MRLIDTDKLISFIDAGHSRSANELCFSEQDVVQLARRFNRIPIAEMIIKPIIENRKYKLLQRRLDNIFAGEISLKDAVDEIERNIKEPDNPNPVNARILTYQESRDWDMYREIGTVDECKKYKFLAKSIYPFMEQNM